MAVLLEPGDTVLVRLAGQPTREQVVTLRDALGELVPGVMFAFIVGVDGIERCSDPV